MAPSAQDKIQQQSKEELDRVARVSLDIRRAVTAALPAPPEQFFTMMVPGKVLNFEDFTKGFDAKGKTTTPTLPREVELAQAILCDDMPALSAVQLGPTGRSVARSYSATLSKLCPAGSTVGISQDVHDDDLSEAERRYQSAMTWLLERDPNDKIKSRIDLYREKQEKYTAAFERKTKAFNDALKRSVEDPHNDTLEKQRAEYDVWVSENQKTYNNYVQAAYMDWVTTGKKEEVEYYFAIVDNDSSMSRVEASKAAMRAAIISDTDGSVEYCKVKLTPSNWAWLAKQKAEGIAQAETEETLTWKIVRLKEINAILVEVQADPTLLKSTLEIPDDDGTPKTLPNDVREFLRSLTAYQDALVNYEDAAKEDPKSDAATKAKETLDQTYEAMSKARDQLQEDFGAMEKGGVAQLNAKAVKDQQAILDNAATVIAAQIEANQAQIENYQNQIANISGKETSATFQDILAASAGIPPAPADIKPTQGQTDYWTHISLEVSSSYTHEESKSSSSSWSAGSSFGWGLWSVGGSASHTNETADVSKQMANSSIKVNFECMRVDIQRPWLRGELFYDDDLKPAPGNFISPGPITLASLMDPESYSLPDLQQRKNTELELQMYDLFPMYPTSFLLAANVVLEITGETVDIQSHFQRSSSSGGSNVGWGPFTIAGGKWSNASTSASSTCEATATGCKITIKSPQIIGWVSQIVPALPRLSQQDPTAKPR
ncbi:hypothetical protein BDM02DRAFT_2887822 [Thelephora ganbajun]|uniref:Uncharacterized protein n=1 Tax=Thelephora ganbajun TaxID=370292 RepID=A0ACB6ZCC4_THEGA|nr:hypothetical protein BDM02DRAFT_2887822 [Thelephora ganbajun]